MSTHQEKLNKTVMLVPDINLVSDGEDKEVIDLEAVARAAKVKLEEDLAKAKTQNDEIAWKKRHGRIVWQRRKRRMRKRQKQRRRRTRKPVKRFWCNLQ